MYKISRYLLVLFKSVPLFYTIMIPRFHFALQWIKIKTSHSALLDGKEEELPIRKPLCF